MGSKTLMSSYILFKFWSFSKIVSQKLIWHIGLKFSGITEVVIRLTESANLWISDFFFQIERRKIDEMRIPEKVTFTLPFCDASAMRLIAKLLSESIHGEVLLETERLEASFSSVSSTLQVATPCCDGYKMWCKQTNKQTKQKKKKGHNSYWNSEYVYLIEK